MYLLTWEVTLTKPAIHKSRTVHKLIATEEINTFLIQELYKDLPEKNPNPNHAGKIREKGK